ncbi:MAG: acyl-CoA dehydrogenase family protein, partial [Silicimonas sp.]|nr:acyl-CoA dehydrogenase family protein [Silicimonas sp.]
MAHDGGAPMTEPAVIPDLLTLTGKSLAPLGRLLETATDRVRSMVTRDGKIAADLIEAHQTAAHGLAWLATYVEALRQMQGWAERLEADGKLGEIEQLILQIAFGEYLWQIYGGIPMSQGEIVRLQDMGLSQDDQGVMMTPEVKGLTQGANSDAARRRLVALMRDRTADITYGTTGLDDELEMIRVQFRRFAKERVEPDAHDWHLNDELIPMEIISELAEMGVFGLTIPEEHGGFGLSKASMVVVSEELSRGYIGVGSLGTRSEIAAELILCGGTEEQKAKWLPGLASGEILPTAVFTEPNTGSDLGSLRTKAVRDGDDWVISGNKTWITHAARTHMMTVLARSVPETDDYRGLSMFLAEKTPGTDDTPFVDAGLSGGEIEVLGYRGMKEYTVNFDDFRVAGDNLLGGEEGQGFKQLMQTFESARIQTAARAIGVAQSALDVSMQYA